MAKNKSIPPPTSSQPPQKSSSRGSGLLKKSVIFGVIFVALALVVTSFLRREFPDRLTFSPNHPSKNEKALSETEFDYVVVGAGTAGSIIASRLSDKKFKVLLLEAGESDQKLEISMPPAFAKLFKSSYDWSFFTEAQEHLKNRAMFQPRGKVVGGSSSMNAMIYIRGNAEDYDEWERLGNKGWSFNDVLPYFKKSERNQRTNIDAEYHGLDGQWAISDLADPHESVVVTAEAVASTLQVPLTSDFNQIGLYQTNILNGRRFNLPSAFLSTSSLEKKSNLYIRTQARVSKVVFEGNRAVGIQYIDEVTGSQITVKAKKEVILSAGAFQTPQILQLSGVGPRELLEKHGIPVIVDNPNVGQNLKDHTMIVVTANVSVPSLHSEETLPNVGSWLIKGRGPLTSNVAEGGAFYVSKYSQSASAPDMQLIYGPCHFVNHGMTQFPESGEGLTLVAIPLQPSSSGHVQIRSANPLDAPLIDPKYASTQHDKDTLIESVKTLRKVYQHPKLKQIVHQEILPGAQVQTDEQIWSYIQDELQTLYHPACTCKMGPESDKTAVVSPQLKVYGVEGLRIADASVMPTIPRGNTNAPTVMVAEKAADLILADA